VLEKVFPQGLEAVETPKLRRLRAAYQEWVDAVDENDPLLSELHREWIRLVLREILEYDDEVLRTDPETAERYAVGSPEQTDTFGPDWVVRSPGDGEPRLFISIQTPGTDLEATRKKDRWPASLAERMTVLCRTYGVRLGLLSDGERWMLVNAPVGSTSSSVSWYARLWFQEPVTLQAFQSLLGIRRCLGSPEETLESLLQESLQHHEEVTDTLGAQVRRAVEVLVQSLDKADADRNRELLRDVHPTELYEAGLTVMMRLVFVLCAEERGLLLAGDPLYDESYAVSTLRGQLAEEADRHGPEVLDRRQDAWGRLLAVFRGVYGGIEHETLRMPALGGSLFDPDRFPFLEGRPKGISWRDTDAIPLPIDNRTVLLLLTSLQVLEQQGGALLLSYRALDVEQIGHVYEGLLEHAVARAPTVTLGLIGSQKARNPYLSLSELETTRGRGHEPLQRLLADTTQRSESAIRTALARPLEDEAFGRLLAVCGGDTALAEHIRPLANLLRTDAWGDPIVYRANAFMVTLGADRRETGTHYTPKSLTETIVATTLEPVAYVGPAEGQPRQEWQLKSPAELLELKVCDPAMGSGAFLVQACRWLAERLVEAWGKAEAAGGFVAVDGEVREDAGGAEPMPAGLDERLLLARRIIAERCLYGVDVNPLAVELAKLSIWLVTLAKGRPFGFLDHNLRHGDSLLGIHRIDQLTKLRMDPFGGPYQERMFSPGITKAVDEAIAIRKRLRAMPIRDIHDVEDMARLDLEARRRLEASVLLADAMMSVALRSLGKQRSLDSALDFLAVDVGAYFTSSTWTTEGLARTVNRALPAELPQGRPPRHAVHWPLEFPEVFMRVNGGFDAIVGNPPFMGGLRITELMGESYNAFLSAQYKPGGRLADLCAFFFRRAAQVLRDAGTMGFLATNTVSQGVTRRVGLSVLLAEGFEIYSAVKSFVWPGKASVIAAQVHLFLGTWTGRKIVDGRASKSISSMLELDQAGGIEPFPLQCNKHKCSEGSIPWGEEFIVSEQLAMAMIAEDARNRDVMKPVIGGTEINRLVEIAPQRWIIDMGEMDRAGAETYTAPFKYLEATIYPKRRNLDPKKYDRIVRTWWKFFNARQTMYANIDKWRLRRVLARSRVSDLHIIEWLPTDIVYTDAAIVFLFDSWWHYSVLQSAIHEIWARRYASTLKTDTRYIAKACFDTFPFPEPDPGLGALESVGMRYHQMRSRLCKATGMSRGELHSRVNDPSSREEGIEAMREIIRQMDESVKTAFRWTDIELTHGFREWHGKLRFTPCSEASGEIAKRLLELNQERHNEEVQLGAK